MCLFPTGYNTYIFQYLLLDPLKENVRQLFLNNLYTHLYPINYFQGTDFQPTNYKFSTPIINHGGDISSYSGNHKSALGNHGQSNYGQSRETSSHKKPKSIALILQRHQGGQQQSKGGYSPPTFPTKTEVAKSGYSSQGFQPIIPKHAGGGAGRSTSLHYNVKSYQASPSYSAIDHTKGATRYYQSFFCVCVVWTLLGHLGKSQGRVLRNENEANANKRFLFCGDIKWCMFPSSLFFF